MSDLFNKNAPQLIGLYQSTNMYMSSAQSHNIDLRTKLHQLLFGDRANVPQGKPVVIRHMIQPCVCFLEEKGQDRRSPDPLCSICKGEGYIFEETLQTAWRATIDNASAQLGIWGQRPPGIVVDVGYSFFFEYNVQVGSLDKIWELALDTEGNMPQPNPAVGPVIYDMTQRKTKYKITNITPYTGDNARVEFYMCASEIETW